MKYLLLIPTILLVGCASSSKIEILEHENRILKEQLEQQQQKRIYHYIEKIEKIPEKPFKVCPEQPKDDDYPCIKMGPTKTLGVQGLLILR